MRVQCLKNGDYNKLFGVLQVYNTIYRENKKTKVKINLIHLQTCVGDKATFFSCICCAKNASTFFI